MPSVPSNEEQFLLQLINRAREDPHAEMVRVLAHPDNQVGINFFNVDTALALSQVAGLPAVAPLAWNGDLADAADWQADDMIAKNYFAHQYVPDPDDSSTWGPNLGQRVTAEGYTWSTLGENLGRGVSSLEESHGQLYIDWGGTPTGIQNPPGHRDSILNGSFRDIGVTYTTTPSNGAPLYGNVTVHNFGAGFSPDDPMIVGVVIDDMDNDDFYSIGEGLGGISVTATGGGATFTTTTWSSGGYALEVDPNVTYTVTFSGGTLGASQSFTVAVGTENVAQDVESGGGSSGGGNTPTTGDDTLTGTTGDDSIDALGGNDLISGLGGDDTLLGGNDNDTINGGEGNDSINGGGGVDSLSGDGGNDYVDGSTGADALISGGSGMDTLIGGGGNDSLSGGPDGDTLRGGSNLDTLDGGDGDDRLFGEIGQDSMDGGLGNDYMSGANANDTMNGGGGDDTMLGQGEADVMNGEDGNDSMNGGASADQMDGGQGNDTMDGGAFNDAMMGGAGDDSMKGGSGLDTMNGNDGNDIMIGGSGGDVIVGDAGNDSIDGGIGKDNLSGGGDDDTLLGGNANDTLDGGLGIDIIDGGSGADIIHVRANEGGDTISGGTGVDTFVFYDFFGNGTPPGVLTTIADFQQGQDTIDLNNVQFMSDLASITVTDNGVDTTLDFGFGDVVVLQGWVGTLQASDFDFWDGA